MLLLLLVLTYILPHKRINSRDTCMTCFTTKKQIIFFMLAINIYNLDDSDCFQKAIQIIILVCIMMKASI